MSKLPPIFAEPNRKKTMTTYTASVTTAINTKVYAELSAAALNEVIQNEITYPQERFEELVSDLEDSNCMIELADGNVIVVKRENQHLD